MTMKNSKNKLSLILCIVLIAAIALFTTACGVNDTTPDTPVDEVSTEAEGVLAEEVSQIGQGEKSFYLSVSYEDGTSDNFIVRTDKTTVGEVLLDAGIIAGEEGPYGLYIKTVNGVTADYDVTGTYWAFYIDGNYASTGADMTDITEGALYSFKIEK